MAKIIPLQKLSKLDYINLNVFHPISLLSTFSKAIKVVIAEKISYLAKKHPSIII